MENQVGTVRARFFTPRLKFKSYEELNAYLLDRCVAFAKAQPHPEQKERSVFAVFEDERTALIPYPGPFDGFRATGRLMLSGLSASGLDPVAAVLCGLCRGMDGAYAVGV